MSHDPHSLPADLPAPEGDGAATHLEGTRIPRLELGAHTLGLSAQSVAEQHEFATRTGLPYPLASDPLLTVAGALGLPTFEVDGMTLYKRLTLIAEGGVVLKAFYPVFPPDRNAQEVPEWLQANR